MRQFNGIHGKFVLILYLLEYLIISFGIAQSENWVYTLNGTASSDDYGVDIVCGNDSSIYIAANIKDLYSDDDLTVISLTPSGVEQWIYEYIWSDDGSRANAVICGQDGNIYVAGTADSFNVHEHVVISLTASGAERWVYKGAYHVGGVGGYKSFIYGADGNLYGAGSGRVWSMTSAGDLRWFYPTDTSFREIGGIIYGLDGNIYIGGLRRISGVVQDIAILSLTPDGTKRWIYKYDGVIGDFWTGVVSICCDSNGNIYGAGHYGVDAETHDFIVASVTPSGSERWVKRYGSPTKWYNGRDILFGRDGNIYAGGSFYFQPNITFTIVSLTPSGTERWVYSDSIGECISMANGQAENIYGAGWIHSNLSGSIGYGAASLTTAGMENWVYYYDSLGWQGEANSIVYGLDDCLYLCGWIEKDYANRMDVCVVSLDPTTSIGESSHNIIIEHNLAPTILRGALRLPEGRFCKIFDITGRHINTANPVPGVYFIEVDGRLTQKVVKVR